MCGGRIGNHFSLCQRYQSCETQKENLIVIGHRGDGSHLCLNQCWTTSVFKLDEEFTSAELLRLTVCCLDLRNASDPLCEEVQVSPGDQALAERPRCGATPRTATQSTTVRLKQMERVGRVDVHQNPPEHSQQLRSRRGESQPLPESGTLSRTLPRMMGLKHRTQRKCEE